MFILGKIRNTSHPLLWLLKSGFLNYFLLMTPSLFFKYINIFSLQISSSPITTEKKKNHYLGLLVTSQRNLAQPSKGHMASIEKPWLRYKQLRGWKPISETKQAEYANILEPFSRTIQTCQIRVGWCAAEERWPPIHVPVKLIHSCGVMYIIAFQMCANRPLALMYYFIKTIFNLYINKIWYIYSGLAVLQYIVWI